MEFKGKVIREATFADDLRVTLRYGKDARVITLKSNEELRTFVCRKSEYDYICKVKEVEKLFDQVLTVSFDEEGEVTCIKA